MTINGNVNTGSGSLVIGAGVSYYVFGQTTFPSTDCSGGTEISSGGSYNLVTPSGSSALTISGSVTSNNVLLYVQESDLSNGTITTTGYVLVYGGKFKVTANDSVSIGGVIQSNDGPIIIDARGSSNRSIHIGGYVQAFGQNIILAAGGSVRVDGNVTNHSSTNGTDIRIFANASGGSSEFVIGGFWAE